MTSRPLPARIVVPVANPATAEELIRLGADLLDPHGGELSALSVIDVPDGLPLSDGATRARHARRMLQRVLDFVPSGTLIHPIVRIGRNAAKGIVEAAAELEADLIVFGWGGKSPAGREGLTSPFSATIEDVLRDAPCDVAVVKQRGVRDLERVVVPVRGGPHAELALRVGGAIAARHGAVLVALHIVPPGITIAVRAQAERALAAFVRQHVDGVVETLVREASNVRAAILREADHSDIVVMGAAAPSAVDGTPYLFGALPEAIATRSQTTVVVVKTRETIGRQTFEQLATKAESLVAADRAAEESRAVPDRKSTRLNSSHIQKSRMPSSA